MKPPAVVNCVELCALNGANPLGFLTALGTLATLRRAGHPNARLGWQRGVRWTPVLCDLSTLDPRKLADAISETLRGKEVGVQAEKERESAQRAFDAAKKTVKDKAAEIKKRKLKGAARTAANAQELAPLREASNERRDAWLAALKQAVPSEELALGKHIDCTPDEYRQHARGLTQTASQKHRQSLDLLAAFGSDVVADKNGRIRGTPFCFITGSGHQYFLDTVRQLMEYVTAERVYQALFCQWEYRDEKFSMRWDPLEDRRYALMDRDPTASDNKSRTVWMANLLAYQSLVLFPCAATGHRLEVAGWTEGKSDLFFTWPIWERPLGQEVVASLLQIQELHDTELERPQLRARGVVAAFRSRRIEVGNPPLYKINFTPARNVL
jgi:hypothetical protein